ncbi:MAG: antiterminator Q family protein [Gallionella sp.]|jgi:hypothetical protein
MKIELAWVDALLSRWGRWAIRCESGALGFASSCILGGGVSDDDEYGSSVPLGVVDNDMAVVDEAVRKLSKVLRLVVVEVYQFGQGKSDRALAEALGMSRQAMQSYVIQAHRQIALDIRREGSQNASQSANQGSCLERKQPATA